MASIRQTSSRVEVTAGRQRLDVLFLSLEEFKSSPFLQSWARHLQATLELEDNDTFHVLGDLEAAEEKARSLIHPLLVLDLRLLDAWTIKDLHLLLDAAGPVSAVVALAPERDDNAFARLAEYFVIDDYRVGLALPASANMIIGASRERVYFRSRIASGETEIRTQERLKKLNRIGLLLSQERDLSKLLTMILRECRGLLDADAGSIYILESLKQRQRNSKRKIRGHVRRQSQATAIRVREDLELDLEGYQLHFAAAQNDSVKIPFEEIVFPANLQSIAGYTALKGEVVNLEDVYQISEEALYRFNPDVVDKKYGYRCVSMLSIPMRNMRDDVVGVIQLINKKRDPLRHHESEAAILENVIPFKRDDLELALSLGNQAGTAIENVRLYDSINTLFESFVNATVRSIEQRDPSTAGHSARVARLTVGVADLIDKSTREPFQDVHFSEEEMIELRYAGILHDVGKIGVREHILTKANKLFPGQSETLKIRAELLQARIQEHCLEQCQKLLSIENGKDVQKKIQVLQQEAGEAIAQVKSDLDFILEIDLPGFMSDEKVERLEMIRTYSYPVSEKSTVNYLITEEEYHALSVRKGSLSAEERGEIESHVVKSRIFLDQIPWTSELANIPLIAGGHHEKMNGKGYPDGIPAAETPLQARIMALADVFDSLTASDRPYKPAIPLERALQILGFMAKDGELDPDLVEFFIEEKVWEKLNLKVLRMADADERSRNAQ